MVQSTSQKRPWLAAVLAVLVTGLGHLYIRRWRRALGWLLASFAVAALIVDPATFESVASGTATAGEFLSVAPMFLVVGLSVADAYHLARGGAEPDRVDDADDDSVDCPHCGKDVDPDLEFCHWCTRSIEAPDPDATES